MQIYYVIEWAPHRGGPNCKPMGVWALGDNGDLQCGFLRGWEERATAAECIRQCLLATGECLDAQTVLAESILGIANAANYCGPIAHAQEYASAAGCVQSVLGLLEKQWDNKKMRWRSGLKMPLERYKLGVEEQK